MDTKKLYCSFCGESQDDVSALVQGSDVCICASCVQLCVDTLSGAGHWPVVSQASLLRGLMALANYIGPVCVSTVTAAMGGQPPKQESDQ